MVNTFRVGGKSLLLMAVILVISYTETLTAQVAWTDTSVYPLPEILVEDEPILVPTPIIVREAEIRDFQAYNAHNISEVLNQSPGINVQYGASSNDARAWVRGFRHRDVLILFDGIPLASAFEGSIDLNEISIENISRVKTMKGAPSVMYGPNGMGGVIDIIPKSGKNFDGAHALIEIGENSSNLFRGNLGGSHNNLNYFASVNFETSDGFSLANGFESQLNEDGELRENSDYLRRNVFLHLNSESASLGRTSFFVNATSNEKGLTPQAGTDDVDFERLTKSNRQTVGFSNQFLAIPLSLKMYYNASQTRLTAFTDGSYSEVDEVEDAEDYSLGGALYSKVSTSDNNLIVLNAAYRRDVFEAEEALENLDQVSINTYTLSAEDEFSFNKRISLAVGAMFNVFEQPEVNESINALNFQAVAGYQLLENVALHASAAQRTRFPKLRELYRERYGNPDLKEQSTVNYEFGFKHNLAGKVQTDVTVFQSDLKDLIERPDRRSLYQNIDEATFKGLELSSGSWLTEKLFGRVGYQYLDASETLEDGSSQQLRSRPKHSTYLEARYKLPFNIMTAINGIYVNELYDLDDDDNFVELPSYLVLHLKASITLQENISAYIDISNLTDKNYGHRLGYPREGRTFRAGLRVDM